MLVNFDSLVVKIAQRCNLACSYCYMYYHEDQKYKSRPRFMSDTVLDSLIDRIQQYCDQNRKRIGITFHGGEPMLMGAPRFAQLASKTRERLGPRLRALQMQTNATLVNDDWISVLKEYDIRVGVSLDGPQDAHDRFRIDSKGKGSYDRTVSGLLRLQDAGLLGGVLCVIDPSVSGVDVYKHIRALGIKSMNFLLPDATHDTKPRLYPGVSPDAIARYLIPIFDEWFTEDDPTVRVRLFEVIMLLILGGSSTSESIGNPLLNYLVVDTDGTIQACDALRSCEEGIYESGLNVVDNDFAAVAFGAPLVFSTLSTGVDLCASCEMCSEKSVCGGGALPNRYSHENKFANVSVWCTDLFRIIEHIRSRINAPVSLPI